MKSRASLVLMEQLIMVLVFALAAALCLQAFAYGDRISEEMLQRDRAVLLAQNGAETLKACKGDLEEAARMLGGGYAGGVLAMDYGDLRLEIEKVPSEIPGLGQAEVRVITQKILFSLEVGWQEVG